MRSKVDLPEPLRPTRQIRSPGETSYHVAMAPMSVRLRRSVSSSGVLSIG